MCRLRQLRVVLRGLRIPIRWRTRSLALLLVVIATSPIQGHDLERTQVTLTLADDGSFVLEIANDPGWLLLRLESFAGGEVPEGLTVAARDARLAALGATLTDRVVLFVDGHEVRPSAVEYLPPAPSQSDTLPPLASFRLRGRLPADARSLRWLYGLVIDPYPLTVRRPDGHSTTEWIQGTDWSGTMDLRGGVQRAGRFAVVRDYMMLGYRHILPRGLDHILFVVGLFLLSTRLQPLLLQVTAFTAAHSLTLALTMYGVVSLPSRIIESLIALSIAYVAAENIVTSRLQPWRLALVFGFGLLHGMGFAGVLADLGLPRGEFVTALLSFNVGVEAGQLTVLGIAALSVWRYRHRAWYHRCVVVPVSLAIAGVGVYWTATRLFV